MKVSISSVFIFMSITTFLMCSIKGQGQFKDVGIKGGSSFSRLNVEKAQNENNRNGYNIGIYGEWSFNDKIGLESSILFSAKGAIFDTRSRLGQPIENKANINYLSLPIQLKYSFLKYFSLGAGIYTGYLLAVNLTRETDSSIDLFTLSKDNFKNFDTGFIAGLTFGIDAIKITYEYTNSFSNQFKGELGARFLGGGKNSTSQISMSFNFLYKK